MIVCPSDLALAAEADWSGAGLPVEIHVGQYATDVADRGGARVLHLVGTPIFDTSGWALRLDPEDPLAAGNGSGAVAVTADQLPLVGVGLVVIQEDARELTWDEDDPLAGFAAAVAAAGARTVVTVPGLPPEAAAPVVGELARSVAAGTAPPTEETVALWAAWMRTALLGASLPAGLEGTAAVAAALKIQLFVNKRPEEAERADFAVAAHQRVQDLKRRAVRR